LQSQNLSKKKIILCEKFQSAKIHCNCIQKQRSAKKTPLSFPKRRLQVNQKTVGILKRMKIPKNLPKLQVIQPYPTFRTWI
jgi:hypothetical protein